MKAIREVLEKYHSQLDTTLNGDGTRINHLDQAEAEIKKIVLGWVGEDLPPHIENKDYLEGFNYAKFSIRKKLEEEL